ncbi:MAG TPA: BamA/TamA family outer membrane protein [bacterium]|nr:BamA/TamA family outer membrane protein [bacterium]
MTNPWIRTARRVACGLAWAFLVVTTASTSLWAQPSSPPPSSPAPAQQQQPTPSQPPAPPTPPAPPSTTPPAQPPAPSLTPPGPFVPQPGVAPQIIPPSKVVEVVVRGNETIPTDEILAVVSTKVNDPLNESGLRNDVQAILNIGEFADAVVRLEPVPDGVRVVFVVVENPIVKAIDVKGNTIVPTSEVQSTLGVATGKVLNTVTMRSGVRAVEKLYVDKGYVLARVADVSVSPEGTLQVVVSEGRIDAIKVEGLKKTHEYVVLRQLTFKPGDVFNVNQVNASLKRLFQLQYFSDVKATPGPGASPDTVAVTISVTEQKTATLSFGLGYSNQTGIEGFIGLQDKDFGGNGQTVSVQYANTVNFGTSYAIAFHEPYFLGSPTALDTQLFDTTTIPTDYSLGLNNSFQYDMTQVGGFLSFTKPIDPIDSLNYGIKAVTTTFGNPLVGTNPPSNFQFTPGQLTALVLGASRDTRNDPNGPTSGEHITLTGEFAFQVLGGSFTFQKYEADYAHFFPIGPTGTLVGHVHVGYSAVPLPIQEQLYLGGQTTLRGYAAGRFRGDESALLQVEYRFPISSLPFLHSFTGITGVAFVDTGDAEPTGGSLTPHTDVGVGIQVKTAIGPFRLDYGVSPEGGQLWISTGLEF